MRVVADTNVVVSAIFWTGAPHKLLTAAEAGHLTLHTSPHLIEELADVLSRPFFVSRLKDRRTTAPELASAYARLAHVVLPAAIVPAVLGDPDDDAVLACAQAARAEYIVTGDGLLLGLRHYHAIHIVSPATIIRRLHAQ